MIKLMLFTSKLPSNTQNYTQNLLMNYFYLFSLYSMRVLVTFDSTKYEFLLQFLKPHLI